MWGVLCASVAVSFVTFAYIGCIRAEIRRISSFFGLDRYENGSAFRSLG